MAILQDLKAAVSAAARKVRTLTLQLVSALGEPRREEANAGARSREESVFQPRKH